MLQLEETQRLNEVILRCKGVVVLGGPTGVGKSQIALALAHRLDGEIVSADSKQVFRGMDIGTATLSIEKRQNVRHHLWNIVDPSCCFSAGEFARLAEAVIREIHDRQHVPLVVGGSGLYLKALLEGLFRGPDADRALRQRLKSLGKRKGEARLHRMLQRIDSPSASQIHPHDVERTIRALEIYFQTGRTRSEWIRHDPQRARYQAARFVLTRPRVMLYERINRRVDEMFEKGFEEEVRDLAQTGSLRNSSAFRAIGYSEVLGYLDGAYSREEAIRRIKVETRRLAKRQLTWFRHESSYRWIEFTDDEQAVRSILDLLLTEWEVFYGEGAQSSA